MNIIDKPKPQATEPQIEKAVNEAIQKAVDKGKTNTRLYGPYNVFGQSALYATIDKYPPIVIKTLEALRAKGYKAQIKCEEKQFVDIYLFIDWA